MIAYKPGILGLCVQGELILTGSPDCILPSEVLDFELDE